MRARASHKSSAHLFLDTSDSEFARAIPAGDFRPKEGFAFSRWLADPLSLCAHRC